MFQTQKNKKQSSPIFRESLSALLDAAIEKELNQVEGNDAGPGVKDVAQLALRPTTIRDMASHLVEQHLPAEGSRYPTDFVEFYQKVFGMELPDFQVRMLNLVMENKYTAITTCTSIGKTMTLSRFVLFWLHTHPNSIVLTTGPSGRQVRYVMWANVRMAAETARMDLLGEAMVDRYQIGPMWFGYGFKASKENISALQGFHADEFLVIIDEATGVPDDIVDVLRNTMIHPNAKFVMLSNPVSTAGRLYDAFHGGAGGWKTMQLGFQDTPNFECAPDWFKQAVRAYLNGVGEFPDASDIDWSQWDFPWKGMINWPFVLDQIAMFGVESAFVQARIWGRFVSEGDVLIPLALIDRAKYRPSSLEEPDPDEERSLLLAGAPYEAGLDVARFGKDRTVLTVRHGPRIMDIISWDQKSTTDTTKRVLSFIDNHHPFVTKIKVDEIGLGGGVVDQLTSICRGRKGKGRAYRIHGINVQRKSSNKERWRNQRQEGYNYLAKLFRRGQVAIGPDEKHRWNELGFVWPAQADAELSDLQYGFDEHLEPVVESKDQFRARRGASPDYADSIMLAFFNPRNPVDEEAGVVSQGAARFYKRVGTTWNKRRRSSRR